MIENVNHPSHYNQSGKKECIVIMQEKYGKFAVICFCWLNSFKYEYRAGEKADNSYEQDLEKAKWYRNYAQNLISDSFIGKVKDVVMSAKLIYKRVRK